MNKEREICGVKVIVSGETYNEYKGTLQEQLEEKDKEIERLKNGIKKLDDMFYETFRISQNGYFSISEWELKDFTDKLKELKEGK